MEGKKVRRGRKKARVPHLASHYAHLHSGHRVEAARDTPPRLQQLSERVSGENSYYSNIQNWLAETCPDVAVAPDHAKSSLRRDENLSSSHRSPPSGALFEPRNQTSFNRPYTENVGVQHHPRRRRKSSSSSSFLELGTPLQADTGTNISWRHAETRLDRPPPSAIRPVIPLDVQDAPPIARKRIDSFQKRKRHKTREDRYDQKKRLVEDFDQDRTGGKSSRQKEKNGRRRKVLQRSGDDLMHEFSSENVGQDRLTMRPSHCLGLFQKGRASSPVLRRGLPDLAFSEMQFLQRSKDLTNGSEKKRRSKHTEKEKRKCERAHNEISAYFEQTPDPVQAGIFRKESYPHIDSFVDKRHAPADMGIQCRSSCSRSTSSNVAEKKLSAVGFCYGRDLELNRAVSAKASTNTTTYYIWSDTMATPPGPATKTQRSFVSASTTPESIRRLLDKTGIFNDTGIDKSQMCLTSREHATDFIKSNSPGSLGKIGLPIQTPKVFSHTGNPHNFRRDNEEVIYAHIGAPPEPGRTHSRARYHGECKAGESEDIKLQAKYYQMDAGCQTLATNDLERQLRYTSSVDNTTSRQALAQTAYIGLASALVKSPNVACGSKDATEIISGAQPDSSTAEKHIEYWNDNIGTSAKTPSGVLLSLPRTENVNIEQVSDQKSCPQQLRRPSLSTKQDSRHASDLTLNTHKMVTQADHLSGNETMEDFYAVHPLKRQDAELCRRSPKNRNEESPSGACHQAGASRQIFAGLPTRGSRSDMTATMLTQSHKRVAVNAVTPLYSHQLRDQNVVDSADDYADPDVFQDEVLDGYESSVIVDDMDEGDAGFEAFSDHDFCQGLYTQSEERLLFHSASPSCEVGERLSHQEIIPSTSRGGSLTEQTSEEFHSGSLILQDYEPETTGFNELIGQEQERDEMDPILVGFWRPQLHY